MTLKQEQQWQHNTPEISRYINTNYTKYGWDAAEVVRELNKQIIPPPTDPTAGDTETATTLEAKKYELQMTEYVNRADGYLDENRRKAYVLILGQCSDTLRDQVKLEIKYEQMRKSGDTIGLLKSCILEPQSHKSLKEMHHEVLWRFHVLKQDQWETVQTFKSRFDAIVDQAEQVGAAMSIHPKEVDNAIVTAKERYLALALLNSSDCRRFFTKLLEELQIDHLRGNTTAWLKNVQASYNLWNNWKQGTPPPPQHPRPDRGRGNCIRPRVF